MLPEPAGATHSGGGGRAGGSRAQLLVRPRRGQALLSQVVQRGARVLPFHAGQPSASADVSRRGNSRGGELSDGGKKS